MRYRGVRIGAGPVISLDLVGLSPLMRLTRGSHEVVIGLLDGPVATDHPALAADSFRWFAGSGQCTRASSPACQHGTFVAGILAARRGGAAPAICPDCTVLVRPIFAEGDGQQLPTATPCEVAAAIGECVDAGARVLNLSAGMSQLSTRQEPELHEALDYAARHWALVVAAAGNQGTLGSSAITRHPWVIPVVGYGLEGRPTVHSNLGSTMGKRGLGAPSENVTSLSPHDEPLTQTGTSFAAAFVTGAIGLLWSQFPHATALEIKSAVSGCHGRRRRSVAPPLLDAWGISDAVRDAGSEGYGMSSEQSTRDRSARAARSRSGCDFLDSLTTRTSAWGTSSRGRPPRWGSSRAAVSASVLSDSTTGWSSPGGVSRCVKRQYEEVRNGTDR
jgi:subtilisin family serine protease